MILFIEIIVVLIVSSIPIDKFNIVVNILISFICAMQTESFKKSIR
ncbi:MAG: DUF1275 family protein [Beduini sp.]